MDAERTPEIDALVGAFYAAFDNRGAREPKLAELRAMFAATATITRVTPERIDCWTPEACIAPRAAMLADGTLTDFHEWETDARTFVFANTASRWSTYEKSGTLDGADYRGRGQKFVQFYRTESRWLIHSILWEDE